MIWSSLLWMLVVFALAAAALVVGALRSMATMLLRPPRMTEGKALKVLGRMGPDDVGIEPFEPMTFVVPAGDGSTEPQRDLSINSWWMPHPDAPSRTCILIHGFADSKIGALAWAPTWRSLGFNLLAIDLRAHGESGGTMCTGAFLESLDLSRVIDELRAAKPLATRRLALFGVSLGGAVALAGAAIRGDVDAVVCDSVFAHYRTAAINHARLIAAPLRSMQHLAIRHAEKTCGADFDSVAPTRTLADVRCPVMLIHGGHDPFVRPDDVKALTDALASRHEPRDAHWVEPEAWHVLALHRDPAGYRERLATFLRGAGVIGSGDASSTSAQGEA